MSMSLPVRSLMYIAIGMYGAPLGGLLAGALIAAAFGAGDFGALTGSLAGCAAAVAIMKHCIGIFEARTVAGLTLYKSGSVGRS